MAQSASSRLGVNKPLIDTSKFLINPVRRAMSTSMGSTGQADGGGYGADDSPAPPVDMSGYMSDGDVLRRNDLDDMNSGYMSEGGATLYARRLQQRFQEGMDAVKECMEKSRAALVDDDRLVFLVNIVIPINPLFINIQQLAEVFSRTLLSTQIVRDQKINRSYCYNIL